MRRNVTMMDEKIAIINELLTIGRTYVDEEAGMIILTAQNCAEISASCSKCRSSIKEIYARPEELTSGPNDYDLVVLKCENCGLYFAYWIPPFTYDDSVLVPAKEDKHLGKRIVEPPHWKYVGKPEWGEGKRPKFSKKKANAYRESVFKQHSLAKPMDTIIRNKLQEMYRAGLEIETINAARKKTLEYIGKNHVTQNQLVALFAAAIYDASHEDLKLVGGSTRAGEKISERQLESIFSVTRKTIRKWRKRVPSRTTDFYL